MSIERQDSQT